jgi:hypothetical protein
MPSPHCDHLRVGGLFEVEYNRSETHRTFLDLLQAELETLTRSYSSTVRRR